MEVKTDYTKGDSDLKDDLTSKSSPISENILEDHATDMLFRFSEIGTFPIYQSVILFNGVQIVTGEGTPEAVINAPLGSFYLNQSGGGNTSMYVKETEVVKNDNVGWVAK